MKKLSVIVLALVLVVSLASVSFAATESFSGEVAVSLSQGDFAKVSDNGKVNFDFTKKYNDNLSAGINVYAKWDNIPAVATFGADTTGFITFSYSPLTVNVKTSVDGKVTKDILTYAIAGGPGVQVDYKVFEGLTATVIGNTAANGFGYLAKAEYSGNGLVIGAGYQGDEAVDAGAEAIGAYGSYTIAGITAAVEFNNRMNIESTNILAKVGGTIGPLTINGAFINQTSQTLDDDNADQDWGKYDALRFAGTEGSALKVDASYKVLEPLTLSGNFQMDLSADTDNMSYAGTATYTLSSALSVAGTYKAFGQANAINVTITDTFVAGLVGTLSLDMSPSAETKSYTAKVVATL